MNDTRWTDEQVHAFVDGELAPDEAARLAASLPLDASLAARVARQRALGAALSRAFDPVLQEPAPQRLLDALQGQGGQVTPIGAARGASRAPRAPALWWGAAAAGVLVALLIGWNLPRDARGPFTTAGDELLAAGSLHETLSQQLSSATRADDGAHIPLSFRDGQGRLCRAFALPSGIDGLACRSGAGWRIEATGRSSRNDTGSSDSYRQAGSALSAPVLAAISRDQAGDVLSDEEERSARDDNWR